MVKSLLERDLQKITEKFSKSSDAILFLKKEIKRIELKEKAKNLENIQEIE